MMSNKVLSYGRDSLIVLIFTFLLAIIVASLYEVFYSDESAVSVASVEREMNSAHEIYLKKGNKRYVSIAENIPNSNFVAYSSIDNDKFPYSPNPSIPFVVSTNEFGFIGTDDKINEQIPLIIFSGGSTTENRYVNENKRFPFLVGEYLSEILGYPIASMNDGKSGRNSAESLIKILATHLDLNPKAIVFYHNINALNVMENVGPSRKYHRDILIRTEKELSSGQLFVEFLRSLFPGTSRLISNFNAEYLQATSEEMPVRERNYGIERMSFSRELFIKELKLFIEMCRIWEIEPVIMTQPSLFLSESPDLDRFLDDWKIRDKVEFSKRFAEFNDIIRTTALVNDAMLIDLARAKNWDESDLYDGIHFTEKGSVFAANYISDSLRQLF